MPYYPGPNKEDVPEGLVLKHKFLVICYEKGFRGGHTAYAWHVYTDDSDPTAAKKLADLIYAYLNSCEDSPTNDYILVCDREDFSGALACVDHALKNQKEYFVHRIPNMENSGRIPEGGRSQKYLDTKALKQKQKKHIQNLSKDIKMTDISV